MSSKASITFRDGHDYPQLRDRAVLNTCGCGFCGTTAAAASRYFTTSGAILFPTDFEDTGASLGDRVNASLDQFTPEDDDFDAM